MLGLRTIAACIAFAVTSGCTGGNSAAELEPLSGSDNAAAGSSTTSTTATPPVPGAEAAETAAAAGLRAEVDDLMARFDAASSALAADPTSVADLGHANVRAWHAVVLPGSTYDRSRRDLVYTDGHFNHRKAIPDDEGIIFAYVATEIAGLPDGTVSWSYCGYNPGISVDIDSGEVLDDDRDVYRGTVDAVRSDSGTLLVTAVSQGDPETLVDGVANPCPALADAAARRDTHANGENR